MNKKPNWIRSARTDSGQKAKDVARLLAISPTYYSELESGSKPMTEDLRIKFCELLRIDPKTASPPTLILTPENKKGWVLDEAGKPLFNSGTTVADFLPQTIKQLEDVCLAPSDEIRLLLLEGVAWSCQKMVALGKAGKWDTRNYTPAEDPRKELPPAP